jgi:hypothetical protein
MDIDTGKTFPQWRYVAATMWLLTALFSLRIVGQALQLWLPQPYLPPFASWQGSTIPYSLLLAIQLVILGAMACASYGAWKGSMVSSRSRLHWSLWLGGLYMTAAVARLAIGYWVEGAPAWFTARISEGFHIVLAGFVLALSRYHSLRDPARGGATR